MQKLFICFYITLFKILKVAYILVVIIIAMIFEFVKNDAPPFLFICINIKNFSKTFKNNYFTFKKNSSSF